MLYKGDMEMPKLKVTTKPKGIQRVHINPKTKEKEYKCSYRFMGLDGKIHQTETPWCKTPAEAIKAKADGIRLHEEELKAKARKKEASKKGTVRNAFEEFVKELELEADGTNYQEQISGKMYIHRDANTILNYYLPDEIGSLKLSKLSSSDFARWVTILNTQKKAIRGSDDRLSGATIRKFKSIILRFNNWLDMQGYYKDSDMAALTELKISRVKVKKKSVGKRTDRNYPTFDEFKKITDYYKSKNLGLYVNMYWYTFYTFLFYSGVRVSEAVGLVWRDIDFDAENGLGVIMIHNAIAQNELRDTVNKRMEKGIQFTKNQNSVRKITIWAAYRQLLLDFKEDSMYELGYSPEELENAYVFPNITARNPANRKGYQRHSNLLRETDRVSKALNLPKYDNQMFRHACAYFLILDQKLAEDDVYRYFGHTDSEMLKQIYAKLNVDQNLEKINYSLKSLITNADFADPEVTELHKTRLERLKVGKVQEEHISKNRVSRVYNQIILAIERGSEAYYYKKKNAPVINRIIEEHPELNGKISLIMTD